MPHSLLERVTKIGCHCWFSSCYSLSRFTNKSLLFLRLSVCKFWVLGFVEDWKSTVLRKLHMIAAALSFVIIRIRIRSIKQPNIRPNSKNHCLVQLYFASLIVQLSFNIASHFASMYRVQMRWLQSVIRWSVRSLAVESSAEVRKERLYCPINMQTTTSLR